MLRKVDKSCIVYTTMRCSYGLMDLRHFLFIEVIGVRFSLRAMAQDLISMCDDIYFKMADDVRSAATGLRVKAVDKDQFVSTVVRIQG